MATKISAPRETVAVTPVFPRWNDAMVLAAGTAESYTVPADVHFLIIEPTAAVWANVTATAVVPTGEITDGTGPTRISTPTQFRVSPGEVISFIREGASSVTISISAWNAQA